MTTTHVVNGYGNIVELGTAEAERMIANRTARPAELHEVTAWKRGTWPGQGHVLKPTNSGW